MYLQLMIKPISWHWTGMVAHFYQSKINKYIIKKKSKKNQRKNVSSSKKKKKKQQKKKTRKWCTKRWPAKANRFLVLHGHRLCAASAWGARWRPTLKEKIEFNGRRYENLCALFSLMPGGKEKDLFPKCSFLIKC